jgi:hypothetical protein
MPNSFDIPLTNTYIQQGTYASLAEKQHKRKQLFYTAYKRIRVLLVGRFII